MFIDNRTLEAMDHAEKILNEYVELGKRMMCGNDFTKVEEILDGMDSTQKEFGEMLTGMIMIDLKQFVITKKREILETNM